jgi:hypothetical protein
MRAMLDQKSVEAMGFDFAPVLGFGTSPRAIQPG